MKKTILLLGGFGFIGSNLIKYIDAHLSAEYSVIVFDKYAHHPYGLCFDSIVRSYAGDFMDGAMIEKIFNENHIDIVIHSLSTTVPIDSMNAIYDIESNLIPTLNMLNVMLKYDVKNIVYFSSGGAVYGTYEKLHEETDDVFPISSYGVVKLSIEKYLMQYAEMHGLNPLILRVSNPYGRYHYSMKQGVINVAMRSACNNEEFEVWGDGNSRKDYIYVDDLIDILFQLINKNIWRQVINVASGILLSVNEIIEHIKTIESTFSIKYNNQRKFDVTKFALDTSKLFSIIAPFSFTPLSDGIKEVYSWIKM